MVCPARIILLANIQCIRCIPWRATTWHIRDCVSCTGIVHGIDRRGKRRFRCCLSKPWTNGMNILDFTVICHYLVHGISVEFGALGDALANWLSALIDNAFLKYHWLKIGDKIHFIILLFPIRKRGPHTGSLSQLKELDISEKNTILIRNCHSLNGFRKFSGRNFQEVPWCKKSTSQLKWLRL